MYICNLYNIQCFFQMLVRSNFVWYRFLSPC